jgi:hypothetical protein
VNNNYFVSCLPKWATKRIEGVGPNAGDISSRQKTQSQKKHASIALMTRVFESFDLVSYSDAQG